MKKDLDEALVRDFPNLYKDRFGNMQSTCMCWGFDVGDGWEPVVRRLSEKLEAIVVAIPESEIDSDMGRPCATQVKEKFGGLRFYMTSYTDAMHEAIQQAEHEAGQTCEICGSPGKSRGGSWIRTLCDVCADKKVGRDDDG